MSKGVVWFEVMGQDGDNLRGFYGGLFGWQFNKMPDMDYGMVDVPEGQVPGGVGKAPQGPGWTTFYIGVDDIEAALKQAAELGGKVLMPAQPMPDGFIAMIADPEGHTVGLHQSTAA